MRVIIQLLLLLAIPLSAHAITADSVVALPEPETFSLLAVGGVALLLAKRKK